MNQFSLAIHKTYVLYRITKYEKYCVNVTITFIVLANELTKYDYFPFGINWTDIEGDQRA